MKFTLQVAPDLMAIWLCQDVARLRARSDRWYKKSPMHPKRREMMAKIDAEIEGRLEKLREALDLHKSNQDSRK